MKQYLDMAYKAAARSAHPFHRMAAVLVRGGAVLGVACNLTRWGAHCERRVLRPHLDARGATIVVVRAGGGVSRPCPRCARVIQAAGVKKVVYVGLDRQVVVDRVTDSL